MKKSHKETCSYHRRAINKSSYVFIWELDSENKDLQTSFYSPKPNAEGTQAWIALFQINFDNVKVFLNDLLAILSISLPPGKSREDNGYGLGYLPGLSIYKQCHEYNIYSQVYRGLNTYLV